MSIRNKLKEREEARDKAAQGAGGGINAGLPEGVTRYVKASEMADGKTFVMLADPDAWYFYYTHEDGAKYPSRDRYYQKHTCLNSPRKVGEDFDKFTKPNGAVCISCKAKAKRKLYFMIPLFDPAYGTWRVFDSKEFHANNLIGDYDKLEKAAKKFRPDYSVVGDAVIIGKTSDGKSYSLQSGDATPEVIEAAAAIIGSAEIDYAELANFRDESDLREIIEKAWDEAKLDKSVLGGTTPDASEPAGAPIGISDDDLPF